MSCEQSIHKFLNFMVAHTPSLQQLCSTQRIPESALVEAFEIFTDVVRHSITAGQNPTDQQQMQYESMVRMMSNAGVSLPDHPLSPRMKIILSSLYEILEGVIEAKGDTNDSRVEMICRLARVGQTLNAVRPKSTSDEPVWVDPRKMGYSREDIEKIAPDNPIAAIMLDMKPLPSPDWSAENIARMRAQIRESGARIILPTPRQVAAFLSSPHRIPRPMPMASTENVTLAAEQIATNLTLWNRLIEDGYIALDWNPSARIPSAHLGGLMGFTFFGPPGTGKSEVLRQVAACLPWQTPDGEVRYGIPYVGLEVPPNGEFGEVLGRPTYDQNGELQFQPSVAVIAAMCGATVGFDEINRSRQLALMLQGAWELGSDGRRYIRNPSPEGGLQIEFPVHPTTIFGATYNPGLEGLGWSLPSAFVDRSTSLHFKPMSIEEQVAQIGRMVGQMLHVTPDGQSREQTLELTQTMLRLVGEVNMIIARADQRLPIIEARRAARLALLASIGRHDLLEAELFSALPPSNHPSNETSRDSLENLLRNFRSNLFAQTKGMRQKRR